MTSERSTARDARVVAQVSPNATTVTEVLTVASNTYLTNVQVVLASEAATTLTYRLYLVPDGGTQSDANKVAWDVPLSGLPRQHGPFALGAGDALYARIGGGSNGDVTITVMAEEGVE